MMVIECFETSGETHPAKGYLIPEDSNNPTEPISEKDELTKKNIMNRELKLGPLVEFHL